MLLLPVRLCRYYGRSSGPVSTRSSKCRSTRSSISVSLPLPSRRGSVALDQDQGRNAPYPEALGQLGLLFDVDPLDAQPVPLLALEVREEALHPPGRPRVQGGEEDE